jgi:TetR/AcrR family transcriptional repressor of nem operon
MTSEKGQKERTRRRILDAASARFREEGIHNVGVASLMETAGLTHGGFYAHFVSKDDLVVQMLDETQKASQVNFRRIVEDEGGSLETWIRWYLSRERRDNPGKSCVAACLAPELARTSDAARAVFTENLAALIVLIAGHLPAGRTGDERLQVASALFAGMMGSLQLSRTVNDSELSDHILAAGIDAALSLARQSPTQGTPRDGDHAYTTND